MLIDAGRLEAAKNAVQPPFMQPEWSLCRHFSKKLAVFLDAFSTI